MKQVLTFFIIILLYPAYTICQSPYPLNYGDNHEDFITELGQIDTYSFEGNDGDVIMIRMRDETKVDAYIKLYNPSGSMIASAWSDGGLAKIKDFKLEQSGTYHIKAYDRNHNDIGKYGISLHRLDGNDYGTFIPELISFEDEVKEIVGANIYKFEASAGDVLFDQMRAMTVHFECEFIVYNSEGIEVFKAENKGRLATVGPVVIDKTDTYKIVVTDRGGNDLDKFGFTHLLLNKHETANELSCGANVSGTLTKLAERSVYRLQTSYGQVPLIETRSNNVKLENSIEIYDENGAQVTKKSATNKLLSTVVLPSELPKSYLILIYDRNGNDFGDFGLQVQYLDDSYCTQELDCSKQSEEIEMTGLAQSRLFSIFGTEGESINVKMKELTPDVEPHLRMYDFGGNLIVQDFDSYKANLSAETYPSTAKYLILASDRSGNDLGSFEIEAPGAGMPVTLTQCYTIYKGFTALSNVALVPKGGSGNFKYEWNTGETTNEIVVGPEESTEYSVTVADSEGCITILNTFVEVINVACGNDNNPKVTVCHVKENGEHQEKCIDESGVWSHINNGNGHEYCFIGSCDQVLLCENGVNKLEMDVRLRTKEELESKSQVFPNPTNDILHFDISDINSMNINITILNTAGKVILNRDLSNQEEYFSYSLRDKGLLEGLYFVKISGEQYLETKSILFIQ